MRLKKDVRRQRERETFHAFFIHKQINLLTASLNGDNVQSHISENREGEMNVKKGIKKIIKKIGIVILCFVVFVFSFLLSSIANEMMFPIDKYDFEEGK